VVTPRERVCTPDPQRMAQFCVPSSWVAHELPTHVPQSPQPVCTQSTGQLTPVSHTSVCEVKWLTSLHGRPLCRSDTRWRVRVVSPEPQVTEQLPQADHDVTVQSTGQK
jgi:hypothetical protein